VRSEKIAGSSFCSDRSRRYNFLFSIAFLAFATIAHSLTIVDTAPIFVIPFSATFLKEPIPGRKWDRIVITVAGCDILARFQSKGSWREYRYREAQ